MPSRWTEQLAEGRSRNAERQSGRGSQLLHEVKNTQLVDMDQTKPDVVGSVERTGSDFQKRLLENPMDHLNKNPRAFAETCRTLYTQYGANFEFSVLLLLDDPLHYDAKKSLRVEHSQKQARQYFGKARPVRMDKDGLSLYSLQIQVVGARVSDLIKDDLTGRSLAASVASREIVRNRTRSGLGGECEGSQITGIKDLGHLAPVLTVMDEMISGQNRGVLNAVSQASGKKPQTITELAHTHGLDKKIASFVSQKFMSQSTALNPLNESESGEDTFIVHPHLTDPVIIIPMWDELNNPQGEKNNLNANAQDDAILASIALGVLTTFGVEGMDRVTMQIISSNNGNKVPLQILKEINR